MLGCCVAPDVQLILEDGATAINCLFGSSTVHHNGTMVIHIGRNALLQDSLILMDCDIGDDSVVYRSLFGHSNQRFSRHMPTFKCGKGSLIYYSAIQQQPDRDEERQIDVQLGNRAALLLTTMKTTGGSFTAGDDFIVCSYPKALQMCLGSIAEHTLNIVQPPMLAFGRDPENSVLCTQDQHPRLETYVETTIGNRFYCGCECALDKRDVKKPLPKAIIGDDVNIVSISKPVTSMSYDRSSLDLILCADVLEVSDGVTLLGQGNQRWPVPHYRKLKLKEGAVVCMANEGSDATEFTAAAYTATLL